MERYVAFNLTGRFVTERFAVSFLGVTFLFYTLLFMGMNLYLQGYNNILTTS